MGSVNPFQENVDKVHADLYHIRRKGLVPGPVAEAILKLLSKAFTVEGHLNTLKKEVLEVTLSDNVLNFPRPLQANYLKGIGSLMLGQVAKVLKEY